MKMNKWASLAVLAAAAAVVTSGCGSAKPETSGVAETKAAESSAGSGAADMAETAMADSGAAAQDLAGTKISFLNTKGEIQEALEDMAAQFEEETGITVDVQVAGAGESPYTRIISAYNSGTAPTMAMLDTTDVVALAKEYALDLSDEKWNAEVEGQVTKIDGKVYSFPFCVEGRGLIYNKAAIEKTLGKSFDPASINSYDALKALLEALRAGGMENPVVLSKEDWSLGAHQLGFIYDSYDGTTAGSAELIGKLKDGSQKVEDYARFNQFVDTFSLLMEYNINGKDPLGALYDQDPIFLADGDAAIWANGSWAWPNLAEADAESSDAYGFLPFVLGNDTADFANNGIQAAASKQVIIDNKLADEQQQAAAREFLNWLVYSESGAKMLVENAALIPAAKNNTNEALDPLSKDIQNKMKAGKTFASSYIAPSDHWKVVGGFMQKYLAKEATKEQLAQDIDAYWESQK